MNYTVTVTTGSRTQEFQIQTASLEAFKNEIRKDANEENLAVAVEVKSARRGVVEQFVVIPQ